MLITLDIILCVWFIWKLYEPEQLCLIFLDTQETFTVAVWTKKQKNKNFPKLSLW